MAYGDYLSSNSLKEHAGIDSLVVDLQSNLHYFLRKSEAIAKELQEFSIGIK